MKLVCECGAEQEVPALEPGLERILFCPRCRQRTRVVRRPDGKVAATRLARPEIEVTCPCGARFLAVPPDSGGVVRCGACGRTFKARKVRRASASSEGPGALALEPLVGVSAAPGRNQDRAAWHGAAAVGCVSDGVTTSLRSDEAAEIVCREAPQIFEGDLQAGLGALGGRLLTERAALLARPFDAAELAAAGGDPRAAAAARAHAYQTTVLAFRIAPARPETFELTIVRCGDSGFLALAEGGVAAAIGVRGRKEAPCGAAQTEGPRHVRFADRTGGTFCIPDGLHAAETCRVVVPRRAWLIAATDGFFDSFEGSRNLLGWLEASRSGLSDPARRATLLADLHRRLEAGQKGDDDIAFVILRPAGAP